MGRALPPRIGFEDVANALQTKCGTLDCHGQWGRNLRLFGLRGLRLSYNDNSGEGETTPEEYEATYWSVVSLEPELISDVVRERGADRRRLTLIRKADGSEKHKGGRLMSPKDPLDRCLSLWLQGKLDDEPCRAVADADRPKIEANP